MDELLPLQVTFAEFQSFVGVAAGIISFAAYIPYVISIVKGRTKPSRATWWILVGVVFFTLITYASSGGRNTLWVVIGDFIGVSTIAILSVRYGVGGRDLIDLLCIAGVLIALLLWLIFDSAVIALIAMLMVDFLAIVPTAVKTFFYPHQENKLAWAMTFLGHAMSIIAIEHWILGIVIYPMYHTASSGMIVLLALRVPKVASLETSETT